jgi:hypothetical protein
MARVTVITAYDGPERWFTAVCSGKSRTVAVYDCAPADPDYPDAQPHRDAVREIEREHPGCFYVYLD